MHFAPLPYLDPGSGSFIIQLIMASCICGTPAAAIAAIIAWVRRSAKKPDAQSNSTEEN